MRIRAISFLAVVLIFSSTTWAKDKKGTKPVYQFTSVIEIPTTPVKDQASSGTCWAYATASFVETELIRLGNEEVDLSEMFFVHYAFKAKAQKYVRYQGSTNFSQGGQGHDVTNVIASEGMIPEANYGGLNYGTDAHQHGELERVMKSSLDASLERKSTFTGRSLDVLDETLNLYLGEVPEKFDYKGQEYTSKSFADSMGFKADDYVEITSFQCYPFYETVDLELPDNWSHDDYYNVPLNDLMEIIDHAFNTGYSVNWDGDVSEKGFSHRKAIAIVPEDDPKNMEDSERQKWDALTEDEQGDFIFGMDRIVKEKIGSDKLRQQWFDNFKTTDDHLMHLVGTAKDQNGNLYYITKNSWADDSNKNGGMLYMSRNYVELKTTAIQIHKDAIPAALKQKLGIE